MKGYTSLLKGIKFKKNKKLNSLFLLKKPQEEKENELNENDNLLPNLINGKNIDNIKNKIKEPKKVLKLFKRKSKMSRIYDDYEDLFFYLLNIPQKIEIFEVSCSLRTKMKEKNETKKENINTYESESEEDFHKEFNNIDINKIFYKKIYLELGGDDKQFWENFYFPKAIYKIIYKKSRLKQKEILSYCVKYEMKYDSVINSYEKIYTNKTKKRNWDLDPISAYNNYMEILNQEENIMKSKELENNKNKINNYEYEKFISNKDIVVKTNNKGNGKTLIFDGKLLDVYVDDYFRNNYGKYIISINSPTQSKKEIFYDSKDLLPKLKQSFSFERNNFLKKNKHNLKIFNQKSNIIMKTHSNMTIENKKNKKDLYFNDMKKSKENIFTVSSINNSIQKNKRNHYKLFLSPDITNNKNYQKTDIFFNGYEDSSNLILEKITNNNKNKIKKAKKNIFNMLKFSYY